MNDQELLQKIESLNVWRRGDQRAPHKPLLLLYALGRLQQGQRRLPYAEVDEKLRALLETFGPPRKTHHPEYPFWRLQNDGLWTLSHTDPLIRRRGNTDPTRRALLEQGVAGGFPLVLFDHLAANPFLVAQVAQQLLHEHFPVSLHDDILDAVGLSLDLRINKRRKRDAAFRDRVLRAYDYRCAVCGFDVRMDNRTIGLEAAHVKWHQAGGPDVESNGMALCTMHHKLLDHGAFTVTEAYRLRVSERAHGHGGFEAWLLRFHDAPLAQPSRDTYRVDYAHLAWHVREVFRGPARVGP